MVSNEQEAQQVVIRHIGGYCLVHLRHLYPPARCGSRCGHGDEPRASLDQ
jgi:hypothetical protein